MAPSNPAKLFTLCDSLRTAVVNGFAELGVPLPDRREIVGTDVVGACEKFSVEFDRLFVGIAGLAETPVPITRALSRVTTINLWVFRCIWTPEGEALEALQEPDVDILDAEAEAILTDAYALHWSVTNAHFNGDLDKCVNLSLGPVTKIKADGGIGGVTMALSAELV